MAKKIRNDVIVCMNINPTNGELVIIVRGCKGPCRVMDLDNKPITGDDAQLRMSRINDLMGVTDSQAEAMLAGSMFGWDCEKAKEAFEIGKE